MIPPDVFRRLNESLRTVRRESVMPRSIASAYLVAAVAVCFVEEQNARHTSCL